MTTRANLRVGMAMALAGETIKGVGRGLGCRDEVLTRDKAFIPLDGRRAPGCALS